MQANWKKYTLQLKRPSRTSRGVLTSKDSYFLILEKDGEKGIGECGLLKGLSVDDCPAYETHLNWLVDNIEFPFTDLYCSLKEFPSIQFGLEMALKDLESNNHIIFPSDFTEGKAMQAINGLIWMGTTGFIKEQFKQRLVDGFIVLKMKIGVESFEEEYAILKAIRQQYSSDEVELRLDANGAFKPEQALDILKRLSELDIHSVEQPIQKRQWQEMALLCEKSPLAIALDEELIGVFEEPQKRKLLRTIKPQYIILKPSFIGGFRASRKWIALAKETNVDWWATSALESNIGLNAIAQWNYTMNNPIPCGLGTGSLYTNNFASPLFIENGNIGYQPQKEWKINL